MWKPPRHQCFMLLVLGVLPVSSFFLTETCSDFFCNHRDVSAECHQLMSDLVGCICYKPLDSGNVVCDNFAKELLLIRVQTTTKNGSDVLIVYKEQTTRTEYTVLLNKLLTYLSLTEIDDVVITPSCYPKTYQAACNGRDENDTNSQTLNLSSKYNKNHVRKLSMASSCIKIIEGKFSLVFPLLSELTLRENFIEVLHSEVFEDLNQIKIIDLHCNRIHFTEDKWPFAGLLSLKSLDLSVNNMDKIDQNILYDLVNLQELNISYNNLKSLPTHLFRRNLGLRVLDLSGIGKVNLDTLVEMGINKLGKLESLSLRNIGLSNYPVEIFRPNNSLMYSNIKNNAHFGGFKRLVHFDLSDNCLNLNNVNAFSNGNLSALQRNFQVFICQRCCLDTKNAAYVANWAAREADLSENPISEVDMNFLRNVAHLKGLTLSISNVTYDYSRRDWKFSPPYLKFTVHFAYPLYVDQNMQHLKTEITIYDFIALDCNIVTFLMVINKNVKSPKPELMRSNMTFRAFSFKIAGRTYDYINQVFTPPIFPGLLCRFSIFCPKKCACYIQALNVVITVNCTNKYLSSFPNTEEFNNPLKLYLDNNHIQHLPNITVKHWERFIEIHLENNWLVSLDNFQLTPLLQLLDLRNNRLKDFSFLQHWMPPVDYETQLMLSGNPFICDCETPKMNQNFIIRVIFDFIEVTCKSIYSNDVLFLANATDTELCPAESVQLLKALVPVSASLVVIISVGALVYYRYRTVIKFWLFTHGFCLRFVTEEDVDAGKVYDAFVSYSSLDSDWVDNHLVPGLENEPPFYKLCLHERDWPVGEWVAEQIYRSVQQSRRTIIVLTENFLESQWSQMEFMAAYRQAVADRMNRVLIVLPGEVPDSTKLDYELKTFITFNTYIKWNNPYFWLKLRSTMQRVNERIMPDDEQETTFD